MNETALISVIIPAYNAERTIADAIRSITSQAQVSSEVIVIDDGSVDGTASIVETLAEADERIRLFTIANGGVGHARNVGLEKASGEWIAFLDADDELLPDALLVLQQAAESQAADLVCAPYRLVNAANGKETTLHFTEAKGLDAMAGQKFFLTEGLNISQPWGKLYRRKLFDGVTYPEGRIYEDISVIPQVVQKASSIRIIDTPVVCYRQSKDSISQTDNIPRQMDGLEARLENYHFYEAAYPNLAPLAADAVIYFGYYLLGKEARCGIKYCKEEYRKTVRTIRSMRHLAAHSSGYLKVARLCFGISPYLFAQGCRLFSYMKNGL